MNWIKRIVHDLINKYKTNDPFELATLKNIHVVKWNLHEEIKGFYKYDRRNKYIFINNNLDEPLQKFVCAHELGHSQLHPRIKIPLLANNTFNTKNKIELEANTFAVELLVPDKLEDSHNSTISEVARTYGVPEEIIYLKKFLN